MKQRILLILMVCSIGLKAQTAQEYLRSSVKNIQKEGATKIILSATLCSVCEGVFEGFIFIKDPDNSFRCRYIKYFDGNEKVEVLEDTIFNDQNIKDIFKIEDNYSDSIHLQINNLEDLLKAPVLENGKTIYRTSITHGKMRLFEIYNKKKTTTTLISIVNSNHMLFEKAYHYWVLNSFINNYKNDFLGLNLNRKKERVSNDKRSFWRCKSK